MVAYWDPWKDVIVSCGLDKPHEFIHFYDGSAIQHPALGSCQMRNGEGIQRWPNGQVYVGSWKNHVYDGEGTLWADSDKTIPVYVGQWSDGVRRGFGTLSWEQDQSDYTEHARSLYARRAGTRRTYHGEFQHGLLNGEGTMLLRGAETKMLVNAATKQSEVNVSSTGEWAGNIIPR